MKIITYNVNGIRAAIGKGWLDWLKASQADVVCLQEVKALASQIPIPMIKDLGYEVFVHSAEKKGYSGTAILTKIKPQEVVKGYQLRTGELPDITNLTDDEGRILRADFEDWSVISVYMPSGTSGRARQDFKMEWLNQFYVYIKALKAQIRNLLIVGDYNIAHQPIDIHNPKANVKSSGFLPEERQWLTEFLALGFVDTFRAVNLEPHNYTWWSSRNSTIRERNLGWRIDYQLISQEMAVRLQRANILTEARHSDHCPVLVEIL